MLKHDLEEELGAAPVPNNGETDQQPKQADEEDVPGDSMGKKKKLRRLKNFAKIKMMNVAETQSGKTTDNSGDRSGESASTLSETKLSKSMRKRHSKSVCPEVDDDSAARISS